MKRPGLTPLNPPGIRERMPRPVDERQQPGRRAFPGMEFDPDAKRRYKPRPVIVVDPTTGIPYGPPRELPSCKITARDLRAAANQHRNNSTMRSLPMGKIPEALRQELSAPDREKPKWLTKTERKHPRVAPKNFTPTDPRLAPEPRFYTWPGRRPVY